jgi:DNA-binding CsgD family transcriptional regulator
LVAAGELSNTLTEGPTPALMSSGAALASPDHRLAMIGNALNSLVQATEAEFAIFYTVDGRHQKLTSEVIAAQTRALRHLEEALIRYRRRYHALDPFAPRRFATDQTRLVDSASLPDFAVLARSPYFTEYLSAFGMAGQTTMLIRCDGRIVAGVDLLRRDADPLGTGQLAFLRASQAMLEHAYDCALRAGPPGDAGQLAAAIPLTRREAEVVRLVAGGASNGEVATALTISESTVKTHLMHAFEKLNVRTRAQLIALLATERATPLAVA